MGLLVLLVIILLLEGLFEWMEDAWDWYMTYCWDPLRYDVWPAHKGTIVWGVVLLVVAAGWVRLLREVF